jgi:hypothetical protein
VVPRPRPCNDRIELPPAESATISLPLSPPGRGPPTG